MTDIPDPVVQTEAELLAQFAGGQPEQLALRNLIKTMYSLIGTAQGDLSAALELLGISFGADGVQTITFADSVGIITSGGGAIAVEADTLFTVSAATRMTLASPQFSFDGELNAGEAWISNTVNASVLDLGAGTFLLDGNNVAITLTGLQTVDGVENTLWQDNAASRVIKVSAA